MAVMLPVSRFGQREEIEVAEDAILVFEHGIVGMAHLHRFALIEDQRIEPCHWLQSVDDPDLAFVVVDPEHVLPGYAVMLSEEDAADLGLTDAAEAETWVILTIHSDPAQSTANLLAPIVVNRPRRYGKQVILNDSGYSLRQPLSLG